jgi:hypothetical protein
MLHTPALAGTTLSELRANLKVQGTYVKTTGNQQRSFEATLRCRDENASGTGRLKRRATRACARLARDPDVFDGIGSPHSGVCTEQYGGPQHATIRGKVNGDRVKVKVDRVDGCGIADWDTLEWLLGRPER